MHTRVVNEYLQKSKSIVSKTSTGPVLPKIVRGWPLNKPYKIPQIAPDKRLSMAACKMKYKISIITILVDSKIHFRLAFNEKYSTCLA